MAATPEGLTIGHIQNGLQTIIQEDKKILTRGKWTTIIYKFREWYHRPS